MTVYITDGTDLTAVADAIRTKGGTSASLEFPNGFVEAIGNISGGGGGSDPPDAVRFYDYDGTLLYQYTAAQFLALSAMPANPTHTGLTAQGWNWTLANAKDYVEDWGFLDIGQVYTTSSGATEIDIELFKGMLTPNLRISPNGTAVIDWGDGSSTDTVTGTSITTAKTTQHTYSSAGKYTIKITMSSGTFGFYHSSSYSILTDGGSTMNYNYVYANAIKAVRLGSSCVRLGNYAFNYCTSMRYVTIHNNLTYALDGSCFNTQVY